MDKIIIKGAREHNLKSINVEIPKNKLVIFSGLSGSGKSSLAFDTIYAEGQRRYVESLSSYARQFLGIMKKPEVDLIEGLSPAISIDQKSTSHNPRSTVGTITEIYDYLRLLYARIGHPHCPNCGREIASLSKEQIVNSIFALLEKENINLKLAKIKIMLLAPIIRNKKGEFLQLFSDLKKRGYKKVRIDREVYRLDEDFILIKTNKHSIDVVIDEVVLTVTTDKLRISESAEQALKLGSGEMIVSVIEDSGFSIPEKPKKMRDILFSEKFACPVCGISIPQIEPRMFSFNTPYGACPKCNGIGTVLNVDKELVLNKNLSISEGGILPFPNISYQDSWSSRTFLKFCQENNISITQKISEMPENKIKLLIDGTGERIYKVSGKNRWGKQTTIFERFTGILNEVKQRYQSSESQFIKAQLERFMRNENCSECMGGRLKKESLSVTIGGKSINSVVNLSIKDCLNFISMIEESLSAREKEISRIIIKEIKHRLVFLLDVGLDYLTLSRSAQSLSGGEMQRIRLASQMGSGLTGVLYVLDEPSIGLHPRDNKRLISTLKKLRDLGNSVIVVEHDRETIEEADYIFDFGPAAGDQGGMIVSKGSVSQIKNDPQSLTGQYLSGRKNIKIENITSHKYSSKSITIRGAREHNLKNIDVSFPLGKFIVVSGVSGSGKSTLINDILYHALMLKKNPFHKEKPGMFDRLEGYELIKHVFLIDQSPIGRTPRSNPATYTGCFTYIRELFAKTKEAKIRGYKAGRFSFNVKGGRCESCMGEGQIKIEMQFLPDIYVKCEECNGLQYNREALEITFNDKNIAEILSMSVSEALSFFSFIPGLTHKLQTLYDVGLSYIKLGQPAPTLSGGEAQRIKLATELSKRGSDSLYLLDEPTTGLHFADLEKLLHVLKRLVSLGNTVIVIEHNLDIIKNADYIIDLGPEGGELGGEVVAMGTPEEIQKNPKSYTGYFLRNILKQG